jgi:hypothetical protein
VAWTSTAAGSIVVNRPGNVPDRAALSANERPVVDHDVRESRDGFLAVRRKRLDAQLVDEPCQHPAHERREPNPGEPVVERLVGDRDPILVVERAEQVGERFDAAAAQRRHHREEQSMRGDRAQACGLTGFAPELIDVIDGERPPQSVTQFGKLGGGQGGQRQSPLLVGVVTPA